MLRVLQRHGEGLERLKAIFSTLVHDQKLKIWNALVAEAAACKEDKACLPVIEPEYAEVALQLRGVAERASLQRAQFERVLLRDLSNCLRLSTGIASLAPGDINH